MRLIQMIMACTLFLPIIFPVTVPAENPKIFDDDIFIENTIHQDQDFGILSNNFFLWCYVETINYGNYTDLEKKSGNCFALGYLCTFGPEDKTTFYDQKGETILLEHEGRHQITYFILIGKKETHDDKIVTSGYGLGVFFSTL